MSIPTSGGHSHGAADLRAFAPVGRFLRDDGTFALLEAAAFASGSVVEDALAEDAVSADKIADSAVTSAAMDASLIKYAMVSLTSAQVKALRATPATLVAAPTAGYLTEFIKIYLFLDYGSNGFTESTDNLAVKYTDGSGTTVSETIEMTGFIDQTADTMTSAGPAAQAILAKTACQAKALVLHNTGDGEIAGNAANDSVLHVRVVYRVHPTGW